MKKNYFQIFKSLVRKALKEDRMTFPDSENEWSREVKFIDFGYVLIFRYTIERSGSGKVNESDGIANYSLAVTDYSVIFFQEILSNGIRKYDTKVFEKQLKREIENYYGID